ncbi:related to hsp70 protein [Fusarium fujikuroi]|nr:related to hsp70 protein [Fusarium fujikuroi]
MTANPPKSDAIIIGIDFGTTYSVTSWDSQLNHCSDVEKAPTQLFYDEKAQGVKWGYGIPSENEPLKWFKLLLLEPKDIPVEVAASTQLQEARRLQSKVMKDPIEIIATFLRNLWDHTTESIKRTLGADLVRRCKLQVVITLPAIWLPYAQQRMKQAAHHDYYRLLSGSAVQTSNTVYCTTTYPPPARAPNGLASVRELCTVTWNKTIDVRKLPKWTNCQRQTLSKLNYRIQMDCEDGTVNFKIIHKGARVGEQNFEV